MDKSIEFLKSLSIADKPIIVGCSGGPDSMCLLNILYEEGYHVICAHVDHSIREESEDESAFVHEYCQKKGIQFELLKLEKMTQNESYYRKKRYAFYKNLADKYKTPYIMTAHHGDDLIETILMRLTRGSHLKGYIGFKSIYEEGQYSFIKPLIFYTKDDILHYLEQKKVPYVKDKTNDENTYTRNRYRHNILPFLKSEYRDVHQKYLQFSTELTEASDFIDEVVDGCLKDNYENCSICIDKFTKLNLFIQKKELEKIIKDIYKDDVDKLGVFHIEKILEHISKNTNFTLDLPLGVKVQREYNELKFIKLQEKETFKIELQPLTTLPDGSAIEIVESYEDSSNFTTRLNSEALTLPLYIRTRTPGDKMVIKNMGSPKKVKDIFIDAKVAPSKRDTYPIVVDSQNVIVWLPGLRKSKFDVNKDGKYDIILKYTQRKENINEKK